MNKDSGFNLLLWSLIISSFRRGCCITRMVTVKTLYMNLLPVDASRIFGKIGSGCLVKIHMINDYVFNFN